MKKLLTILSAVVLTTPTLSLIVSCGNSSKLLGTDLSDVNDYDWSSEEPYFKGYQNSTSQSIPTSVEKELNLDKQNSRSYIDYSNFSTGFKTEKDVLKQTTTGVPLNSHFLPNGNYKKDMELVEKKDYFKETNSILDWDINSDKDAKYNVSRIPLQKTTKTAEKWVSSQDPDLLEMNMSTIIPSTSMGNQIVGYNKSFERSINNYQYNDVTVSWGGAIDEGIILPPAANEVQKAHLNGTKILGNIFLDGYHGLKVETLRDFLKKDSNGNYLLVNKLVNMAKDYQFDGWFWNNEPNGSLPEGTILSYKTVIEIMQQWNNVVKNSNDPYIRNLLLYTYKNNGTLLWNDKTNEPTNDESAALYENSDYYLTDFGQFAPHSEEYMEKTKGKKDPLKVFNMYNAGGWVNNKIYYDEDNLGRYDTKLLAYTPTNDEPIVSGTGNDGQDVYTMEYSDDTTKDKHKNNISIFASHVSADIASQLSDKLEGVSEEYKDIYKLVASNYYDDMMYTGHNRSITEEDKGVITYTSDKSVVKDYSYGVGNIIQENTVLNDFNDVFFTNFSTGNGKMFNSLDENGKVKSIDNYPWSNSNIGDVQPTYKWKIDKVGTSSTEQLTSDKVSGYYDYYNPYLKGNSISLGNGFNNKGEIQDFNLDTGSYNWWIMGTNYQSKKNKTVEMIVKPTGNVNKDKLKIIYDDTSDNSNGKSVNSKVTELDNGWYKVSATINSDSAISKIGLQFNGGKGTLKVGQMKVVDSSFKTKSNNYNIDSVSSELDIKRESGFKGYRLNFNNIFEDNDLYSYYEIYAEDNDKMYRISESNKNDYYIKNLNWDTSKLYVKIVNNLNNEVKWISINI
ncbi:endo-beta-N-acetylglucosaminidase [Spiroplasma corruscae]|uniref:Endo-beta-N-acetylglucosaminidase n=1 Tax=Spiroplasma corruscae TaxID=216934 RepID=A0A222EPJ5_9MOLU|nr:lipoprotein [Spiroplasma corruscae]ASP28459.1 endo-beta-N-acetylglucosaminidase [Spiroplasma corruscae]